MRPTEIRKILRMQPFVPLRVHVTDGRHFDIPHPEWLIVSHTCVAVGTEPADDGMASGLEYLDPLHVVSVRPVAAA